MALDIYTTLSIVTTILILSCHGRELTKRQAEEDASASTTTGPIKSFKRFNVTENEAEKEELPSGFGDYNFAGYENDDIVERHNLLRRRPAARNDFERNDPNAITSSDMEHMTWDEDLAYMAMGWARYCNFAHGQPENVSPYSTIGQNLWAYTGNSRTPLSGADATQDWYDEVTDYNYQPGSGGSCGRVCGHYTQVVWAATNKVGCGRMFCPSLGSTGLRDAWYVVCNYAPGGNYQGVQPYAIGEPCTSCASGSGQCYNGQCRSCAEHNDVCECSLDSCENCGVVDRSTCTCNCPDGFFGTTCQERCVDTSSRCYNTWWPQFCADYPQVREGCPQMCGICNAADPDFVCRPGPEPPVQPPVQPTRPEVCDTKFTAAAYIGGVLHLFRNDRVWRVRTNGELLSPVAGDLATDFFSGLPSKVSAAYELSSGEAVFARGKKLFTYRGTERSARDVLPKGIPKGPTGALHITWERNTYFFKGSKVYLYNEATGLDSSYPRPISEVFPDVPTKLTNAFSDASGNQYFVRSKKVFKISYGQQSVDNGYPKFLTETFINICAQ
ncbi:uncharacterized protein LOC575786 [Strongylocentrotus purpuratus]|uniref:SCP domain-containing protein n=1 Tax=Strongylocentrotus purpuratus TaxID=7668 RepID=A0A7M7NTU2_STRPU|nr:uncharacterized protein LOC575786 [Strongylocentrotus purpuratus]